MTRLVGLVRIPWLARLSLIGLILTGRVLLRRRTRTTWDDGDDVTIELYWRVPRKNVA